RSRVEKSANYIRDAGWDVKFRVLLLTSFQVLIVNQALGPRVIEIDAAIESLRTLFIVLRYLLSAEGLGVNVGVEYVVNVVDLVSKASRIGGGSQVPLFPRPLNENRSGAGIQHVPLN